MSTAKTKKSPATGSAEGMPAMSSMQAMPVEGSVQADIAATDSSDDMPGPRLGVSYVDQATIQATGAGAAGNMPGGSMHQASQGMAGSSCMHGAMAAAWEATAMARVAVAAWVVTAGDRAAVRRRYAPAPRWTCIVAC